MRKPFAICFLFFCTSSLYSQYFLHFSTQEGLATNSVWSIEQDKDGFIWIANNSVSNSVLGVLEKFDGYSFKRYMADNNVPTSINGGNVEDIYQDKQGNLWVFTASGLDLYQAESEEFEYYGYQMDDSEYWPFNNSLNISEDSLGNLILMHERVAGFDIFNPKNKTFRHFREGKGSGGRISSNNIRAILTDPNGIIWVGGVNGLDRVDIKTNEIQYFKHDSNNPSSLSGNWINSMDLDEKGKIWIAHWGSGISRLDPENVSFEQFREENTDLSSNFVRMLKSDENGHFWVATLTGLDRFDSEKKTFEHYPYPKGSIDTLSYFNNIMDMKFSPNGDLWLRTKEDGVMHFDKETQQIEHFNTEVDNPHSIRENTVTTLLIDRTGLVYFGYQSHGFSIYYPNSSQFKELSLEDGLSNSDILAVLEGSDGKVWIGSKNGLDCWDVEQNSFTSFAEKFKKFDLPYVPWVGSLLEDSEGNIWLGTAWNGVFILDKRTNQLRRLYEKTSKNNNMRGIPFMIMESDSIIWIPTVALQSGITKYNLNTKQEEVFYSVEGDTTSLTNNSIYSGFIDDEGNFWIGSYRGFDCFDPKTGKVERLLKYLDTPLYSSISYIHRGKNGLVYLTAGNGLGIYNPETHDFELLGEQAGLTNMAIQSVLEDDQGNLWISTSNGIFKFFQEEKRFMAISMEDGISNFDFWWHSCDKGINSGNFYFGSSTGMTYFHPNEIEFNNLPPKLAFTKFEYKNSSSTDPIQTIKGISQLSQIDLTHKEDLINIEFAALDFTNPSQNQYAYKIDELHEDWIPLGTKRELTFTNLSPDDYTLRVRGSNKHNYWNYEGISLLMNISPPWWQTIWAYSLYGIAFFGILYLIRRNEIRKQKEKLEQEQNINKQLRRIDQLKDQFLANTSHELRTPLQGIIGLSEDLYEGNIGQVNVEQKENLSMIIASGRRLNNLVNDILDFSKLKSRDIELVRKPISMHVLADIVLKNHYPLIKGKPIELINEVDQELPNVYADEDRIIQVLFNLIGNAIKFTENGEVKISAEVVNNKLQIKVRDTGIGIPQNKMEIIFNEFEQVDGSATRQFAGTGLGLSISKKLVELHNGEMWVESEVGEGSVFTFTLPITNKEVTEEKPLELINTTSNLDVNSTFAPAVPITTNSKGFNGKEIRILIVDDEPVNQRVLKNHLSAEHFQVTQALTGKDAIDILNSNQPFDLVLLDVMMPRMSGYEVCQKIREKYLPSELPIIMITARNQVQDLVQGLALGANDYLAKPFSKEEFMARINTQLDLHKIFSVTGRFIPNEFIRALGKKRITEVNLGDQAQKNVTVMFTDIRDFTTLAEQMTPEQNFHFVNAFHGRMGPIIQKNNGFVNQYLGDAIMAIFPKDPKDSIQASIEMQLELQQYNQARKAKNRSAIRIGIGMHSGPLIMGIIGDENRMDAATISDTVNAASRIEGLTKYFGTSILMSEHSLKEATEKAHFPVRYLGKILLKGKFNPTGIYECFGGDLPELIQKKMETKAWFDESLNHYLNKDFLEAANILEKILDVNPTDGPAQHFLRKATEYAANGVPENWTGIESMKTK